MRCSSVDLPDPEGPIRPTNSPLAISISTSFSATTWNSSRTNSLVSRRAVTIGSLMSCLFYSYLVAVFQIRRRRHDEILASHQTVVNTRALTCRRPRLDRTPHRLTAQSDEDSAVAHRRRGYDDHRLGRTRAAGWLLIGNEGHVRIHLRPQILVGLDDSYLDLHCRLLPIGLGGDLFDIAFVGAVAKRVGGDHAALARAELGEIVLADIQLHLQIVQVRQRHHVPFGALVPHEAGGDELTLLHRALKYRAGHWSA